MKPGIAFIFALFGLLVLGLSGCSIVEIFSSSDDEEPPAELIAFESEVEVRELWTTTLGKGAAEQRVRLVPFIYQGRVFIADRGGDVKAVDALTGEELWKTKTKLRISAGPGAGEGAVLLGTSDAEVVALDETNGEQMWRVRVSSEVLSVPRVAGGVVVVQTIDGKVEGLDFLSGKRQWVFERSVPVLTLRGTSSPVIVGNQVICGFANGKLVALDLVDGKLLWEASITTPRGRSELERMVDIDGDPVVRDDVVYVATFQGDVAAVALETGIVLWRRDLSSYAGIGADWRYIYLSDAEDSVWAFDPRNGSAVWRQAKMKRRKLSAPAILDDYVVVGDFEGYLHWLFVEDGHMVARHRVGGGSISAKPRVFGDTVYVYTDAGRLTALTLATAEPE